MASATFNRGIQHIAASHLHVPGSNTAAAIVLAAISGKRHILGGVVVSYSAAPTGGRLTIVDGSSTVFDVDILAGGPTVIPFSKGLAGTDATAMTITLAAGGSGITGKLNLEHQTE